MRLIICHLMQVLVTQTKSFYIDTGVGAPYNMQVCSAKTLLLGYLYLPKNPPVQDPSLPKVQQFSLISI